MEKQQKHRHLRSGQGVRWKTSLLPMICLLTAFVWGGCQGGDEPPAATVGQEQGTARTSKLSGGNGQVVVTYFHTTFRCHACTLLEEYSRDTVEKRFAKEIEQGKVVFRHVNIQEAKNQHFIKDYKLYTKSLVVSEVKNGKETRWKNLPDIWRLLRNREQYERYVANEIEDYLKDH